MENPVKKRSEEVTGEKLDSLIGEITTDAYGDDERAFHCAFKDGFKLPCDAFVIGEPVFVIGFDYGGNQRRGLVARCRKKDGPEHRVAVSEVAIAEQSWGGHLIAAYRKWAGLNPWPEQAALPALHARVRLVPVAARSLRGG